MKFRVIFLVQLVILTIGIVRCILTECHTVKPVLTEPCEFQSRSGKMYLMQHYAIKFVSDQQQDGGFLRDLQFPTTIKLTAMI